MMLKKFRYLALVMALVLGFVYCTTFAAKKPVKLVLGSEFQADHYYIKACLNLKKLVEKESKGQIKIDVFPASQLGGAVEMFQATMTGAQQMMCTGLTAAEASYPKLRTFALPYLYRDDQHFLKVLKKGKEIINEKELAAKTGVNILTFFTRPARQLTTNFPVKKLEDIKGLKLRVPETAIHQAMARALGTVPITLPWGDVYTGLATGTIEAQENPLDTIYINKIYEVQKYIALTSHMREMMVIFFNYKTWNSLTPRQKKIFTKAAHKSSDMVEKIVTASDKEYYEKLLQEGMKFTKPNLASFREKAKTVWAELGDPELIKKIQAIK
jgi:tripartite ATP-independent transporter DctP family solute receptor